MSSDNPNPEQAQAKIATALGRLRGDVMPPITSQAAPRLSDQIGTTPLPTASTLRAEPTLGGAAASPAPANLNPSTVAPMTAGNPAPVSLASLGGANGPATGSLGNNASGTSYLGTLNTTGNVGGNTTGNTATGSQPDLLAGVDMGPPPLGADYPRAEADDGRRKRNRRLVGIAAVVAAVVIVGFWFTTRHRGEVPEIAADTSPEKVKPTDQGGLQVPNQNVQVLENMNGQPKAQAGETVLPPPEQPVAPPAVTDQTAAANPAAPATDTTQQAAQTAPAAPAVPSVQAPAVPASPSTGTTATPTAPAVPAVPAVPAANTSAMTSTPAVPATTVASAASNTAAPSATPTTATTTEPAAKTTTTATPTTAPAGKLRIQLAAVKTEAAAKSTWAKLQKAHPAQLGNLSLMVEKVDKGAAGIFYRVQAGPFSDTSTAKSVCSALSAQGQACILAR